MFGPFSGPFGDPFSVPLGTPFRVALGTHLGTENDHLQQLVNYQHSVGVSSLKCRVGHNPHIAQSPSHSLSHPSDGFATTPARTAAGRASFRNFLSVGLREVSEDGIRGVQGRAKGRILREFP